MKHYVSIIVLALLILGGGNANAYDWTATDWMSGLPNDAYLSELSIPGTHDSATGGEWDTGLASTYKNTSQTQTKTLSELINTGIRALDFRPLENSGKLICAHGIAKLKMTFEEALHTLTDFLTAHPNEFFVVHLYYSNNDEFENEKADYYRLFNTLLNDAAIAPRQVDWRPDLTVADMRGKILFLSRNDMSGCAGYKGGVFHDWAGDAKDFFWQKRVSITRKDGSYRGLCADQDVSNVEHGDKPSFEEEVASLENLLNFSMTRTSPLASTEQVLVYNFCSAHKGNTLKANQEYAENATHTDKAVMDYLASHTPGPTGIIMMDYAGADSHKVTNMLISKTYQTYGLSATNAIIGNNFKYLPMDHSNPAVPDGFVEVTDRMQNASLKDGTTGWTPSTTPNDIQTGVLGYWNQNFQIHQTLTNMPAGIYRLTARGFYRNGGEDDAYASHNNNTEALNAKLYLGSTTNAAPLPSLYNSTLYPDDKGTGWQYIYADNITEANACLNVERNYTTETPQLVLNEAGSIDLGVMKEVAVTNDWTTFTGFHLYYQSFEALRAPYTLLKDKVLALRNATAVYTDQNNALATLDSKLNACDAVVNATSDPAVVATEAAKLLPMAYEFVSKVKINRGQCFDLTDLAIANADLDSNIEGWTSTVGREGWVNPDLPDGFSCSNGCVEIYGQTTFDFHQTLANMPAGDYKLTVKAFSRPADNVPAYQNYQNGTLVVPAEIYANSGSQRIKHVFEEYSTTPMVTTGEFADYNPVDGKYYPNGMEGAHLYFAQGHYLNTALTSLDQTGDLTIGFRSQSYIQNVNTWTIFDEFRLYYYGTTMAQELNESEKFFAAANIPHVDVTLHKTLYQGWNTVVLPFDAPVSFLGNGQLYSYTGESDGVLNFTSATTITANTPYIYNAPADCTTPLTIDDVTLVQTPAEVKAAGTDFHLIGSFDPATKVQAGDYVMGESAFLKANGGNAVIAYRAYIKNESPEETPAQVRIRINGEETTAIEAAEIISALTAQPVYNLQGQRMSQPRKGINVIGGKKIIKK